jgi:hypothetical protein
MPQKYKIMFQFLEKRELKMAPTVAYQVLSTVSQQILNQK